MSDAYRQHPVTIHEIPLLSLLIVVGVYSGNLKVSLFSKQNKLQAATISLGFITTILSLLVYGPVIGIITGISTIINANTKKEDIQKTIFNLSNVTLTSYTTYHFLDSLNINTTTINKIFTNNNIYNISESVISVVYILASVLFHHIVNSLLFTVAISLSMKWTSKKSFSFFRNNTLWVMPTYLAAGCFITMLAWIIFNLQQKSYSVVTLLLVILPQPLLYFHNLRLHRERDEERERRFKELESLYSSMVQAMGRAIEAKDRYTQEHIARVVAMSMAIGRKLTLPEDKLRALEVGAALHDIGKIAIPEAVLNKPGKLTPEEFELIKEHAALGSDILQPVPFPPEVVEAVRHHHEKWDGSGYPDKLAGNNIPLMARIVAVADVYDALTSDRPYRAAWSHDRAMEFMRSQVGTHFNPEIFAAFESAMLESPELCSQAIDPEPPALRRAA
jgi:putative nucleotidyltransferase with HDIG domain